MKSQDAVRALGALAQDTRLAVFRLLVEKGPEGMTAGTIAEKLGIRPATLSFHLKELSVAGLLDSRTEGRFVIYSTRFDRMNELLAFLTSNCCGGNPCTPVKVCLPPKRADKAKA